MSDGQQDPATVAEIRLRAALDGAGPTGIRQLSPDEMEALAGAIEEARSRQAEAIETAAEEALGFVPRLLRAAVRKIVFQ